MTSAGASQTNLTSGVPTAFNDEPAFSPDGSKIAFVSERDGNPEIYVMDADGSNAQRLTDDPAADADPAWSADGTRIYFDADTDGNQDVYSMKADGSDYAELARFRPADTVGLGQLMEATDGNFAGATNYLAQAHSCYSTRDDILRVILEEADAWNKLKKPKRGIELLRTALRVSGNAAAAPLLRSKEQELRGGLTTPTPGPSATPRVRVRF